MRFMLLGLAYLFASTLNLAKTARDVFDADYFEVTFGAEPTLEHTRALSFVVAGTPAFRVLNTLATGAAFTSALAGVWLNAELERERKALFCVALLFLAYAAFQVSKLVRDYNDKMASAPRTPYAFATWFGFVAAIVILGGTIVLLPATALQRRFFALASFFVLSSVLALSKLLRDDQERADHEAAANKRD